MFKGHSIILETFDIVFNIINEILLFCELILQLTNLIVLLGYLILQLSKHLLHLVYGEFMLSFEFCVVASLCLSQILLLPFLLILELALELILRHWRRSHKLRLENGDFINQLIPQHVNLLFYSCHIWDWRLLFGDDNKELRIFKFNWSLEKLFIFRD